jgi:2-polyprenyl-6-methoxyphenol hydroxylase-like FAD-dependent oxidoreductase
MVMQTWRSDEDTGLAGKGKEAQKLEKWLEMGAEFGPPFKEVFETMDPSSTIWHNRLGYWPTKPWDSKGLATLAGDAAHPMTFRKFPYPASTFLISPYLDPRPPVVLLLTRT